MKTKMRKVAEQADWAPRPASQDEIDKANAMWAEIRSRLKTLRKVMDTQPEMYSGDYDDARTEAVWALEDLTTWIKRHGEAPKVQS